MPLNGYTKLFNTILTSTIWEEPDHTRIVWITMLAMADQNGIVAASLPGLARLARIDRERCQDALETMLAPDQYSRSPEFEGRRIERVEGGWKLLNHAKYMRLLSKEDRREYNAQKQRESRERKHSSTNVNTPVDKSNDVSTSAHRD